MTHSRRQISELLQQHDVRPSRALGQNFVADANTVRRIVRLANIEAGDRVVEVGPGLGSLTLALLDAGAQVTAIEIDRHLLAVLKSVVEPRGAQVVHGDALKVDWSEIAPATDAEGPWTMVANLPYNMGTSIVVRALETAPQITRLVVMVQREVAERLAAGVGHSQYGALSVKVAYYARAKVLGTVPPTVFVPQPEVESAIVELRRLAEPPVDPSVVPPEHLFALVRAGFGQRRKMLRRALGVAVTAEAYVCAGVDPTARGEQLDLQAWGRLAACSLPAPSLETPGGLGSDCDD